MPTGQSPRRLREEIREVFRNRQTGRMGNRLRVGRMPNRALARPRYDVRAERCHGPSTLHILGVAQHQWVGFPNERAWEDPCLITVWLGHRRPVSCNEDVQGPLAVSKVRCRHAFGEAQAFCICAMRLPQLVWNPSWSAVGQPRPSVGYTLDHIGPMFVSTRVCRRHL